MNHFLRIFTILALSSGILACNGNKQSAIPEALKGTWSGEIEDLGLALVLHLEDSCTMDSPDQGAYGLPATLTLSGEDAIKVKFQGIPGNVKGKLDGDSLICTFSQLGLKKRLALGRGPIVRNRPQTPQPPFPYRTEDVDFEHDGVKLTGTLSSPELSRPEETTAVVLVSGSGQQNRDEELMAHRPFAVLADALARGGVASLRYDDRGCGGSGGVFEEATTLDFADDARAALRILRARGFNKVGVIGHSEGGTIAFMLAADEEGTPDFIVSLAGMADRGDSTIFRQLERMAELQGVPKKLAGFVARASMRKTLKQKSVWADYFLALDPAPYVSGVKCPCLALNGDKDCQVIPEFNLSKIETLCPAADCRLYPGLNHLFQHCTTGLGDEYSRIEETMSPEVLSDILAWIRQQ